jgi:hypothetical protein
LVSEGEGADGLVWAERDDRVMGQLPEHDAPMDAREGWVVELRR